MQIRSNAPVIELHGTVRQQGEQVGEATVEDIRANIEMVRGERARVLAGGLPPEVYDKALRRNEAYIKTISPETIEEIEGVAAGAGLAYEDLLDLNLMAYFPLRRMVAECSQLLVAPPRTAGGRWFLAKTRDMSLPSLLQTVVHRRYGDGTELAEVIHSGAVTSPGSGLNSAGLALSTSGVWPKGARYSVAQSGTGWNLINPHLLLRGCGTVDEVEKALEATSRLAGLNIVAMDGEMGARFEVTTDSLVRTDLADGQSVLTNHCPSPQLQDRSPSREEYASTFDRYDRLTTIVETAAQWDETDVWHAMSDHEGYPNNSVCRHPVGKDPESSVTAYASVATLPDQTFHVAVGNPCEVSATPTPDSHESRTQ